MNRHKTGCGGPCSRDRHCDCFRCAPKKRDRNGVTGPTGPCCTGPTGFGVTGPTGPCCTGPTGPGLGEIGSIEKWSGLLSVFADVELGPLTGEVCTYLADAVIGGLTVAGLGTLINVDRLGTPPNYPSTRRGITFDELAVSLHAFAGLTPIEIPEGAIIVVELVENAEQDDESVCLAVRFETGEGGIVIPVFDDPPLRGRAPVGTCTIEPDNTYDVRVCIRNEAESAITIVAGTSIEVSATARVVSA